VNGIPFGRFDCDLAALLLADAEVREPGNGGLLLQLG
jgi:hypothetical protein